ncbi:Uncharacterized protein TCM_043737 [Theobroma cacao]|uniref:Uncharacterized protein n=1 Tax=Theobroma cacao TaxID=3641 RepID=A0A061FQ78_THECC|nr:Uncharacterized protein TCM_043737 [Theobroma cacao]
MSKFVKAVGYEDPRVTLHFGDGVAYLEAVPQDLITATHYSFLARHINLMDFIQLDLDHPNTNILNPIDINDSCCKSKRPLRLFYNSDILSVAFCLSKHYGFYPCLMVSCSEEPWI